MVFIVLWFCPPVGGIVGVVLTRLPAGDFMIRGGFSCNCARRDFLIYWGLYLYYGNREGKVMAFDGITIANIRKELDEALTGGRVYKIAAA